MWELYRRYTYNKFIVAPITNSSFVCIYIYIYYILFKEDYVKIEHDYIINCATLAHGMGCKRFSIISAMDAKKDSFILYQKTKVFVPKCCNWSFFCFQMFSCNISVSN